MVLVQEFLEKSAERTPDKVALICDGQRLTYSEIDKMANRMAHAMREYGIKRGDRVILYLHNSIELVVSIFAVLKAEGVFVVINPRTKRDKLIFLSNNCRASAIVFPNSQNEFIHNVLSNTSSLKFLIYTGRKKENIINLKSEYLHFKDIQSEFSDKKPLCKVIDLDLACLIYTSGTTGFAKGVMCGHNNIVFSASSITKYLENRPDDIVINGLPLSFDYGLYQLLMTFKYGGTLILEKSFTYPVEYLKKIESEKVTGLPGVPTLFSILLQLDLSVFDLSSLRYITNTAAALPSSHIQEILKKFPNVNLYSMYGLTETKRTLYLPPEQLNTRPDSVGIAIPGTEVWIEDDIGNRLGPDEIGELVIRGGHVMRGYWEDSEATAERFRSGRLHDERCCYSGDLFRMDQEGFYYFVGRKDDIIKCQGEKVAPKEVENVLYSLTDIIEAAVVGVPDPVLGHVVKAFVVLRTDASITKQDILRHCRTRLEDFMVPQFIEFCEILPKSDSGKIKKSSLACLGS